MIPKPILVSIAASIVAAGCQPANAPSYAVRVSLTGAATPINGVSYDRFFEQSLDDTCRVSATRAASKLAIAGPVGSTVSLGVDVNACRPEQAPPEFSCSWTVTPRPGVCAPLGAPVAGGVGQTTGADGSHRGDLQIPDRTGIYDAVMSCTVGDGEPLFEPIRSTIYATYRAPVFMVSPPEQNWYAHATAWGCGFTARADEKLVLKQVLDSQYAYGRNNWRYGVFDAPATTAYPPYDEGGGWLNCPWQSLVDETDPCNFADCFEFSQVFEHMSATLGIGGFEPIADVGNAGEGFRTVAESFSLDPRFPGNINCTEDGGCEGYLFSSHSLRKRDDVYYDATFNKIYDAADSFIDADVDQWADGHVTLAGTDLKLESSGRGYGTWTQWKIPGGQLVSLLFPPPPPPPGSGATVDARVTRTMLGIMINATVELASEGSYVVRALLARDSGAGDHDWKPARSMGSSAFSDRHVVGAGAKQLSFSFGYPAIESTGGAGSHVYRIEVFDHPSGGNGLSAGAPRLVGEFEQSVEITKAQLDGAKGADIVDVEIGDVLPASAATNGWGHFVARYTLSIPPPERHTDTEGDPFGPPVRSYTLQARLAGYETLESLAYAGDEYDLDEGTHTVTLTVPLPPAQDPAATEHLELTTELIGNRSGYWYEDSVAFRRFSLDFSASVIERVDLRSLLDRRVP